MATVYPLRCFRPSRHFASKFVRKPSDFSSMNKEEVLEKLLVNSVFSISQPELFGYTFEEGKEKFARFLRQGYIFPEVQPAFYVYEIKDEKKSRLGLVCNQNISDLSNGKLLMHEKIKAQNSQFLENRLTQLKLNFTPIFSIAPEKNNKLKSKLNLAIKENKPEISISLAGETHQVYKIKNQQITDAIKQEIYSVNTMYLADGHHRLSVLKKQGKKHFSTVVFPESDVSIYGYAKILRQMPPNQMLSLYETMKNQFSTNSEDGSKAFEIFYDNSWQTFYTDKELAQAFDQCNELMNNHFQITNIDDDDRVLFLKDLYGKHSIEMFMKNMHGQMVIRQKALSVQDIMQVANKGESLPAKSTLFYPKPRAGLFITRL